MLSMEEMRRHLDYMVLRRVEAQTGVSRYMLVRIQNGQDVPMSAVMKVSGFLLGMRGQGDA